MKLKTSLKKKQLLILMNNFEEKHEADDKIRQAKKKERQQYDKDRYLQSKEIYIARATLHRQTQREDIPKMKARILKELETGKKTWVANKTMIKYNITENEIKLSHLKLSPEILTLPETLKCENACSNNCIDIKARFTCGH